MTDTTIQTPENTVDNGLHGITIRTITTDQSGKWLQAGWRDFKQTPAIGLTYGALCVLAGWLVILSIFRTGQPYLTLPLAAGFMLLAPLVAVGLYETSRRLEMGENVTIWHSLNGFRRNPGQIGAIGVVLMLFFLAWTRIAMLLFALFYNGTMPSLDALIWETFFSRDAITFLITGSILGGALAIIVFAISVVSIPLLVDRDVDVITAVIISVNAFRKNWKVLIGWAAVIAILAACGMVVFMFGLAIMMPLLGYSSWHAYRGIIDTSHADVARLRRQVP
ncbi:MULTISPECIES: DUF2189 domain-containing protein [Thalassospira]|uniref:DUF2189 domain-containing protein n=1 Tax=Thalassospira povalilytica TaxID=732237 RepID=A0A8I1M7A3_9PROT|nr:MULTISPECIES: DUF2189 domain-containing protein [Thalassospira]RCK22770.1 membrane protein [Thalassospira profundimaris]KZB59957.1 hypothetical protein AUQ42_07470 [Thalassospira sp. MCCC 1A02491]MBN8196215.1 DUF2189 domain-containing protein [Thalassospira povalilytica]MBO6772582.1 DUF2189 domain-containing protein [Thalassospira sp.]PKR52865.1 DUF2189 domain-containing protein [Thalassospira povalilytica]